VYVIHTLGNLVIIGNLVIMGFSVYLCQWKSSNKHLLFSIHVSHVSFIPPLVPKTYVPCIFHVRTFPVQLIVRSKEKTDILVSVRNSVVFY
jgi:hypothetical protein